MESSASPLEALVEEIFGRAVPKVDGIGIVAGAVHGGEHLVRAFGQGDKAPGSQALFQIGSVTKTFTALLFAEMVSKGEVRAEDSLSRFFPAAGGLRNKTGEEPTLIDIATHTAGLPRVPRNLWRKAWSNRRNPYVAYTAGDLQRALAVMRLRAGKRSRYSNLGFALLGHALSRAAGTPFEDLVAERVCKPLEMRETVINPQASLMERHAQGRTKRGKAVMRWELPTFAGAGAISSTATDMLAYVRAHLHPETTPLTAALQMVQTPHFVIRKDRLSIGLAWMIVSKRGQRMVWHGGATGGFSAFAALDPDSDAGVVVLANSNIPGRLSRVGLSFLEQLSAV